MRNEDVYFADRASGKSSSRMPTPPQPVEYRVSRHAPRDYARHAPRFIPPVFYGRPNDGSENHLIKTN